MSQIVLFHGTAGWAVSVVAIAGWLRILHSFDEWATGKFARHGSKIKPGAFVSLGDGRYGTVLSVARNSMVAGPIAAVRPEDPSGREQPAEWIPASRLAIPEYDGVIA